MELISPTPQPTHDTTDEPNNSYDEPGGDYLYDYSTANEKTPVPIQSKTTEEKITTIESDLFIARISSMCGGSIVSFQMKDHLGPDSAYVNLSSNNNKRNLLIGFRNLDGELIELEDGWVMENPYDSLYIQGETTLSYFYPHGNKEITKKITIYPESFLFDIELDMVPMAKNILEERFSFSWVGGLPPTEKDSTAEEYFFGAYIHQGGELLDVKASKGDSFKNDYRGKTNWVATRSKYFLAATIATEEAEFLGASISAANNKSELYDLSIYLNPNTNNSFSFYLGPLEYERIKGLGVDLESTMDFGWAIIRPISKGVLWALKSMHNYIPNYGVVLIIFSVLVKLAVYPLTKKSYESTRAMQALTPELNKLKEKYKNNQQKLQQAQMDLYKKKGVNPFGTCLPMLLQMPLLFALFTVFRSTIELRGEPFIWWIKDLSAPDIIFYLPFKIPLYGNYVCALPILMAVSMYAQQKMMMTGGTAQQDQQRIMQYFMMGFFFLIFNSFPSGLNLYYTLFNLLTIVQQKLTGPNQQDATKES
tara:strand:- start:36 stop:1640 length:1605 start_codon:yes stop_codon:yes gene_type:complete